MELGNAKRLYVDLDSTLNNAWERIARNGVGGRLDEAKAFSRAECDRDEPLPWAREALAAFADAGWIVTILTARGYAGAEEQTRAWLDAHGVPCHGVIIVANAEAKAGVLREHRPHLFVDDFMAAYETGHPRFVCHVYEACARTGVPVEPFRNNWPEIVKRWLGVDLQKFSTSAVMDKQIDTGGFTQ